MMYSLVVLFVAQSQTKSNHDNVCVVRASCILNVSTNYGVPVDSDSLADMLSLKDITSIVNKHFDLSHSNFEAIPNYFTYNKTRSA